MFRVLTPIIRTSYCTTVITPSGTGQPCLLPSALRADGSRHGWPVPEAVITAVRAPDDGCQHPKHVELSTEK